MAQAGLTRHRARRLSVAVLAAVAFFASAPGQSFLISVFVDEMLAGTGLSRTTFSSLYAAGTIVSAVSMLVLGRVIDRRGPKVGWLVVSLALAVACGIASLASGALLAFVALATLRTFGQGSFPLVGTLLVARSFERRRGQAIAIANLGGTGASVLLPPAVAALILAIGWRHSYQVLGAVLLLVILPLALLIKDRAVTDVGGDGSAETPVETRSATRTILGGRLTVPTRAAGLMLLILAAPPLIGTALTFHAVSILAEKQIGFLQASFAVGVTGVAAALGTITCGLVADRLSNRILLTLVSLSMLAAPLVLLLPHPATAYVGFAILGLGMGSTGVINGTIWARTYGTAQLGRIQGTAQSAMITSAAVAPLVPAVSLSVTGGYGAALWLLVAFAALTTVVAVRIRHNDPHG